MPVQREARFSVLFAKNLVQAATMMGVEAEALLFEAGMRPEALGDLDGFLGGAELDRLWRAAAGKTRDPLLGLHIGEHAEPASLGLLGFAMLSSRSVGDALGKLSRYWSLLSNASMIAIRAQGGRAELRLETLDLPGNFLLQNRHPVESSLSAVLRVVRALSGSQAPALRVAMMHEGEGDKREYQRVFGRMPDFGAEANCIEIPAETLERLVVFANPSLVAALEAQIERRLQESSSGVIARVRGEIGKRLRGESAGLGEIAKAMGKSERAVQRELQESGTSFREVLDDLRRDLAVEYMRDSRNSLLDISFFLGLSEPSVLHRCVKRWFGCTPAVYRRRLAEAPAEHSAPERPS